MQQMQTFLASHTVLHTQDIEEAREAVAQRYCDHRLDLVRGRRADVRHNHARGVHVSFNLLGYGAEVTIDPGELQAFYLLQIPIAGAARITHRSEEIDASPACATVLNPDRPTQMVWAEDCTKLMMQIDSAFLHRVAEETLGMPLPGQIRFAPKVDLTSPAGQRIRRLVIACAQAIESGDLPLRGDSLQLRAVEREIALALLEAQPSNLSHVLALPRPAAPLPGVRRALSYIHAHFAEDIRLDDIARATALHPRTLQIGFREALGVSPLTYLRNLRLDTARFHLNRRSARPRVSDVAYDCGFNHLGRFSKEYRARFGVTPSVYDGF